MSPSSGSVDQQGVLTFSAPDTEVANPLDQLSSADIAVHVAKVAHLEETTSVVNKADTVNAQMTVTPADTTVAAKPQVVATALKSRKDIQTYVAKEGDTVSAIAAKFSVTSDSVRWSNSLTGENVAAGRELYIPPVSGVVYVVKAGDTPETLAAKYHANRDQIVVFNDAEVSGLPVGQRIVIPDGVQSQPNRSNDLLRYGNNFAWGGGAPVYNGGGYDYGYCTYWAALRRSQIGRPVPSNLGNASTWKVLASRAGLGVGGAPQPGAVIWTPPRDYYGHVGFVESVNPDGSVNISEMNTAGWGRVSHKTLSPADAARYSYIY